MLTIRGKDDKTVLVPLPPAVARAINRAGDGRDHGPFLRNVHGVRTDRQAATRRLKQMANGPDIQIAWMQPHMLPARFRDHHARHRRHLGRPGGRQPCRPANDRAHKNFARRPDSPLAAYMAGM